MFEDFRLIFLSMCLLWIKHKPISSNCLMEAKDYSLLFTDTTKENYVYMSQCCVLWSKTHNHK